MKSLTNLNPILKFLPAALFLLVLARVSEGTAHVVQSLVAAVAATSVVLAWAILLFVSVQHGKVERVLLSTVKRSASQTNVRRTRR